MTKKNTMTKTAILAAAATAFGVSMAACGGSKTDPKAPVSATEARAAGSASGEHSCGAKKDGSCSGKKEGSCSGKKDDKSEATPPAAPAETAAAAATTAAPASKDAKDPKAAAPASTTKPKTAAAPAAKSGSTESGCGAGSCAAKKKKIH